MAQLNALDHALLGDIAREVSIRIGEFTVAHDGTNDQIVIPLGPGVAVSATLIPVTSRVLGRETRLGTKLIVESINALDAGPTRKRAAPFDPEILFSTRIRAASEMRHAGQEKVHQQFSRPRIYPAPKASHIGRHARDDLLHPGMSSGEDRHEEASPRRRFPIVHERDHPRTSRARASTS